MHALEGIRVLDLGAHTDEVLSGLLGLDQAGIAALRSDGVA